LRENWGAPFVLAFILLLLASAVLLSSGNSNSANNIAVYAFYALVLGVVLQIASYIRYGEERTEKPSPYVSSSAPTTRSWKPGRKTLAIVLIMIIVIAAASGTYYYKRFPIAHTTHKTILPLKAGVNFIATTPGIANSVQVTIGINESGGLAPFNYTGYWSDGVNQSNTVGVFIRTFLQNQTVPSSLNVTVSSSDGQVARVLVVIPFVNRTTTTFSTTSTKTTGNSSTQVTTSSLSEGPFIFFTERGLPSGVLWSVTLGSFTESSSTDQIVFNVPPGSYNYSISEPYDSQNFSKAFVASPLTGDLPFNKANIELLVNYSTVIVTTPKNQIFNLKGERDVSFSNGTEEFTVTYSNNFPVQVHAIVVAIIRSNSTGSIVAEADAPIGPAGYSEETTTLIATGLAAGQYSVSLYVQTSTGVDISQVSNLQITIF
jgi:hypothetical protein